MKSSVFGIVALFLCPIYVNAEAPDTLWTKTYGGTGNDVGNSIKQTSDGGYIIAGYTESFGAGQQDVWLLKTNANGDTVWTKTYGGTNNDWAADVQQTDDGGYIIAATTQSVTNTDDMWLIKTDSLGNSFWMQTYGKTDGDERAFSIQKTSDGGYIVSGNRSMNIVNPGAVILLKTDADGDTVWCRHYYSGPGFPWGLSIIEAFDGGYVVAGAIGTLAWFTPGFLLKTDLDGDSVWANFYMMDSGLSVLTSVRQTTDSGYIACGQKGYGDLGLWIVRVDSQGDSVWMREYVDSTNAKSGFSVQTTTDNGYIFTGGGGNLYTPTGNLFLFKTDGYGDSLWCTVYGGAGVSQGNEVLQTNDGGYLVVGCTEAFGAGNLDVWLIKTEPDVGIEDQPIMKTVQKYENITATIFRGPLQLPESKKCKVFDITGRIVEPSKIQPGIYFIEIDGVVIQKVVKVR